MRNFRLAIFDFRFGSRGRRAIALQSKIENQKSKIAVFVMAISFFTAHASAKTIVLTDEQADRMAAIVPEAPLAGWAGYASAEGAWSTVYIDLRPGTAFLMRYPLDQIPKGMKITNAELMIQVYYLYSAEPRFYAWRMLQEWGVGACYTYRTQRPQKAEWAGEGARGSGTDRATRPTVVLPLPTPGEKVINVTQDVELWYTGAAPNHGWMFTAEDAEAHIRLDSPLWNARGKWKLRITYEPQ
jgi:hypothetical protein